MGNIPVKEQGSQKDIRWADGQKQVYTDGGRRVDIYEGGQGRPDGPGHDHYVVKYDRNGNVIETGGRA